MSRRESWKVRGKAKGIAGSWREKKGLGHLVEKTEVPFERNIPFEGSEIYVFKDRHDTVGESFNEAVEKYSDREAAVFEDKRITYEEFGQLVDNLAESLKHDLNVEKGDRISFVTRNCLDFYMTFFASAKIGSIIVPHNIELSPEGLKYQIDKMDPKVIISEKETKEKLNEIIDDLDFEHHLTLNEGETIEKRSVQSLMEKSSGREINVKIDEWDPLGITFTSGTTGRPKASVVMHLNEINHAMQMINVLDQSEDEYVKTLVMVPFFHATSFHDQILPIVMLGGTSVIMQEFEPKKALEKIEEEEITLIVGAPVMIELMTIQPEFDNYDLNSVERAVYGGHAAAPEFVRRISEEIFPGCKQWNVGGISESCAISYALPDEDAIDKAGSVGLAGPNTEITLFDEEGYEVKGSNEPGELAFKGAQTTRGYWREPEKTKTTYREDGYVLSGDIAKVDEDGYIWILDRIKDMIPRGGQNVYCVEVENVVHFIPEVADVAVLGVPDRMFAERVKAVVQPKPGENIEKEEIIKHCEENLADYEVPEYVVVTEEDLPKNPGGKTMKPPLKDYWGPSKSTVEKFEGFLSSLGSKLQGIPLISYDDETIKAEKALDHLKAEDEIGEKLKSIIEEDGIIELLK